MTFWGVTSFRDTQACVGNPGNPCWTTFPRKRHQEIKNGWKTDAEGIWIDVRPKTLVQLHIGPRVTDRWVSNHFSIWKGCLTRSNNPGPILFALFRCPTRCWKHHVLVVESAEGLMQTSCDISVSHHQQRHRQKQQQRRNTASATITNCGKEESENNNVLFSSERASQRF